MKTALQVIKIRSSKSFHTTVESSQGCLLPCFGPEQASAFHLQSWPNPLNRVRACVQLLFEGGDYFFHGVSSVATIRQWLLFGMRLLFEKIWYVWLTYITKQNFWLADSTGDTVAVNKKLMFRSVVNRSEVQTFPFSHHSTVHACARPSFLRLCDCLIW